MYLMLLHAWRLWLFVNFICSMKGFWKIVFYLNNTHVSNLTDPFVPLVLLLILSVQSWYNVIIIIIIAVRSRSFFQSICKKEKLRFHSSLYRFRSNSFYTFFFLLLLLTWNGKCKYLPFRLQYGLGSILL